METTLSMDFVWITWNLRLDMVNLLSLNLGFFIELYPNLRFLEIKVGITHKEQDNYGILPLLLDSWLNERKLS